MKLNIPSDTAKVVGDRRNNCLFIYLYLFFILFIYNNSARCQAKPNSADNATKLKGSLKKKKKEHQT